MAPRIAPCANFQGAYNDGCARGIDSNHRYVLNPALLDPLRARGWISQGIVFCVPAAPA